MTIALPNTYWNDKCYINILNQLTPPRTTCSLKVMMEKRFSYHVKSKLMAMGSMIEYGNPILKACAFPAYYYPMMSLVYHH